MDSKMMGLQRDVKILMLQIVLIGMFRESGKGVQISLAQIPLNLKKNVGFEFHMVELGFPKLKNLLSTLSERLGLETTKSHVSYHTSNSISKYLD